MIDEINENIHVFFSQAFCEMIIKEGQAVCVELVARNPMLNKPRVLFLGSIKYEALKKVYDARVKLRSKLKG